MELDVYFSSLSLAFEYQGQHHYSPYFLYGLERFDISKERDEEKRTACKASGLTLIEVPYWWKKDRESILELVHYYRPDIVPNYKGAQTLWWRSKPIKNSVG
jgi:hypothetical protein